jgi:hypothetical protein
MFMRPVGGAFQPKIKAFAWAQGARVLAPGMKRQLLAIIIDLLYNIVI